ncbi:hypothetical protein EIP91_003905 [Steccherinum ochraceum]|uniref:Uncharacterized protein n=1 Tax=Steccherinum ochraceum TaxID=92696 RepID=A0A4V6N745_9APHY|nr:hypothetical protein EIP91_003905 [Steccherinum ochraceum]
MALKIKIKLFEPGNFKSFLGKYGPEPPPDFPAYDPVQVVAHVPLEGLEREHVETMDVAAHPPSVLSTRPPIGVGFSRKELVSSTTCEENALRLSLLTEITRDAILTPQLEETSIVPRIFATADVHVDVDSSELVTIKLDPRQDTTPPPARQNIITTDIFNTLIDVDVAPLASTESELPELLFSADIFVGGEIIQPTVVPERRTEIVRAHVTPTVPVVTPGAQAVELNRSGMDVPVVETMAATTPKSTTRPSSPGRSSLVEFSLFTQLGSGGFGAVFAATYKVIG